MAMPEEELVKQQAAAGEEGRNKPEVTYGTVLDPFGLILQQLNKLDTKIEDQRKEIKQDFEKLDTKIEEHRKEIKQDLQALREEMQQGDQALREEMKQGDQALREAIEALHYEVHGLSRWAIGTIIAVAVGLGGVIASLLAILARMP